MTRSCTRCLFCEVCPASYPCKHFSPLLDVEYSEYEETQNKDEYYQAWLEYIKDFD